MLAVVLEKPGALHVREVAEPDLPQGGLTVRMEFVGVCGSDVRTWRHGNPRLSGPQILGHEVGGVVEESDVSAYPAGTKVAICPGVPCLRCSNCQTKRQNMCAYRRALGYDFPGGMAERFAVPREAVEAGCVIPLPGSLSTRDGALAEPLHTVLNGQDRAGVSSADSVLVLGLGPIGTLHVAVAQSRGALAVLGLDPLEQRVRAAGAVLGEQCVEVLDDSLAGDLRARGGTGGWDVVVLATAAPAAVSLAMSVVASCGRLLLFAGMPAHAAQQPLDLNAIHYRQLSLVGAFAGTPMYFARAVAWLASTRIDLEKMVTNVHPLADAEAAFARVEAGDGLKTMLTWT